MCFSDDTTYAAPAISSLGFEALIDRYLHKLEDAGIPDPLGQTFTLSAVLGDLYTLAEVPPPAAMAAVLGAE